MLLADVLTDQCHEKPRAGKLERFDDRYAYQFRDNAKSKLQLGSRSMSSSVFNTLGVERAPY